LISGSKTEFAVLDSVSDGNTVDLDSLGEAGREDLISNATEGKGLEIERLDADGEAVMTCNSPDDRRWRNLRRQPGMSEGIESSFCRSASGTKNRAERPPFDGTMMTEGHWN
jgi:hypothetical protein